MLISNLKNEVQNEKKRKQNLDKQLIIKLKCFQKDNGSTIVLLMCKTLIIRRVENQLGKQKMLIRRHLPNGRSNHCEIAKPLIFKGLIGKYRQYDQRLNYRPIYTINTDIQSVTRSALENKRSKLKYYSITRKQIELAKVKI